MDEKLSLLHDYNTYVTELAALNRAPSRPHSSPPNSDITAAQRKATDTTFEGRARIALTSVMGTEQVPKHLATADYLASRAAIPITEAQHQSLESAIDQAIKQTTPIQPPSRKEIISAVERLEQHAGTAPGPSGLRNRAIIDLAHRQDGIAALRNFVTLYASGLPMPTRGWPAGSRSALANIPMGQPHGGTLVHQHSGHILDCVPAVYLQTQTLQIDMRTNNNELPSTSSCE